MWRNDVGIDLGTTSVLLYVKGKGIVLREPSVVALDRTSGKLLQIGTPAAQMLGRTPVNLAAICPLRAGVVANYEMTVRMLKEFLRKAGTLRLQKPRVILSVPSGISEVEERAAMDAAAQAGARRVYLMEEPLAAAIGAGIDVTQPDGHLIADIGGGTTDIAVISLSGVVVSTSIQAAGDQFDAAIVKYLRKQHKVFIGKRTAEQLKLQLGCVLPPAQETRMEVKGRCLSTGLPQLLELTASELIEPLAEVATEIAESICSVLERTPPELSADLSANGIVLTGGGSLLQGLDQFLETRIGIAVRVAEDAPSCVALGVGAALDRIGQIQDGVFPPSRRQIFPPNN